MAVPEMKNRPNFFLIGTAKGGTTFLAGLLDQHEQIYISKPKEPQFFSWRWRFGWDWYAKCFEGASGYHFRGDASTLYSAIDTYPDCLPRIKRYFPDAKIIYIVRDPLVRITSFWKTHVRSSSMHYLPFEESVRTKSIYIDSSQYWKQYSAYAEEFGEENIRLFFFEDFILDPLLVASECVDFLGAQPKSDFDLKKPSKNAGTKMRRPKPILKKIKRNMRFLNNIYAALPDFIQRPIRLMFKDKIESPVYSQALRAWVLDQVREDAVTLLRHFDKPLDRWDLG